MVTPFFCAPIPTSRAESNAHSSCSPASIPTIASDQAEYSMSKAANVLALLMLGMLGGCAERTDFYDSLKDVEHAKVFEKGWLPEKVLPSSTNTIRVSTLVDVASGDGSFDFACSEYSELRARLRTYDSMLSKVSEHNELVERRLAEGYIALSYSTNGTHWIFLCKDDPDDCSCDFVVWQPDNS